MKLDTLALVFPGQGSQSLGMLSRLSQQFSVVKQTFSSASEILGYDLWDLCQEGPTERLNETLHTQPAVLTADVAMWRCWLHCGGVLPTYVSGHSLGEYAALVAAEVLNFEDAVAIVQRRAQLMQEVVAPRVGAMAAIVGLSDDQVRQACVEGAGVVSIANYNSIGQIAIAGEEAAVDEVIRLAQSLGAKLARRIPVSVPCHCELLRPAMEPFAAFIAEYKFSLPNLMVLSNVDAKPYEAADEMRARLVKQLVAPVRWVEIIQNLAAYGVKAIDECGPGKVLTGLNRRIDASPSYRALDTVNDFNQEVIKCP